MSKIIAIDCDEVLVESIQELYKYLSNTQNLHFKFEDTIHYFISKNESFGLSDQEALSIFDDFFQSEQATLSLPVTGAFDTLSQRKKQGFTLILITARNEKAKNLTYHQINTHYPDIFSDIQFAHHYTDLQVSKSSICKSLGARLLVEDNLDYALEVAEQNISCVLFEKPRNIHRKETHPLIYKTIGREGLQINDLYKL